MAFEQHAYEPILSIVFQTNLPLTLVTERYEPFSTVTQHALQHALAEAGTSLSQSDISALMQSYDSLSTFPDVAGCLRAVAAAAPDISAVVFSNGTRDMVGRSVANSPALGPQAHVFADIVTVDDVRRFKPDPDVYRFLCRKVGKEGREGDVWLVSGNPFDVVGARSVGMNVAWVDRLGLGWVDACVEGEKGRPTVVVKSLEGVVQAVTSHRT